MEIMLGAMVLVLGLVLAAGAVVMALSVRNRELMGSERERVGQELDGKKSLIDQQLGSMNAKLDQVSVLMQTLEADREQKFGQLSEQLTMQHAGVTSLLQTSDRYTRLQMNRAPALSRAESEHRKLLRLCRQGKVPEACDYLVAHIEKVRRDLHALLKRGSSSSKPVKGRP